MLNLVTHKKISQFFTDFTTGNKKSSRVCDKVMVPKKKKKHVRHFFFYLIQTTTIFFINFEKNLHLKHFESIFQSCVINNSSSNFICQNQNLSFINSVL